MILAGHTRTHVFRLMRKPVSGWLGHMLAYALCLALAIAVLAVFAPVFAGTTHPSLFGYPEVQSENLSAFKKWTGALDRYFSERQLEDGSCTSSFFNRCHLKDWQEFLAGIAGEDRMAQLRAVNRYMNKARYVTDPVNYRMPDYWATPRQFLDRNGDCEDYAIAKYLSLRALGFPADALRVVVLQDMNLRIPHAILVVYLGDKAWVLDNQIRQIVASDRVRHYRPIYSINEEHWWVHRGQRAG